MALRLAVPDSENDEQLLLPSGSICERGTNSTMKNIMFPTIVETTVESLSWELKTWKYTFSKPPTLIRVYLRVSQAHTLAAWEQKVELRDFTQRRDQAYLKTKEPPKSAMSQPCPYTKLVDQSWSTIYHIYTSWWYWPILQQGFSLKHFKTY